MNTLSTWLDTIGNVAGRVNSLVNPARPIIAAVDTPAPATDNNKVLWLIGGAVALVVVVLLLMRGKG